MKRTGGRDGGRNCGVTSVTELSLGHDGYTFHVDTRPAKRHWETRCRITTITLESQCPSRNP
jgi:hypothetical protein